MPSGSFRRRRLEASRGAVHTRVVCLDPDNATESLVQFIGVWWKLAVYVR